MYEKNTDHNNFVITKHCTIIFVYITELNKYNKRLFYFNTAKAVKLVDPKTNNLKLVKLKECMPLQERKMQF